MIKQRNMIVPCRGMDLLLEFVPSQNFPGMYQTAWNSNIQPKPLK
jgi:hypothetical protein